MEMDQTRRTEDAIISLWKDPNKELSFTEIQDGLLDKGLLENPKNYTKANRALKRLIERGLVEKTDRGRYRLNVCPDEFQLFDYLESLRERLGGNVCKYRWDVGGTFWKESNIYLLGMKDFGREQAHLRLVLDILLVRLSRIFESLRVLAWWVNSEDGDVRLPRPVIREALLETIPLFLGSRSGPDFDGLDHKSLVKVLNVLAEAIPEEVAPQVHTEKETIVKYLAILVKMSELNKLEEDFVYEQYVKEELGKFKDFALVATLPDYIVNEDWHETKTAIDELKTIERGFTPLEVARKLLNHEQDCVDKVMKSEARLILKKHFLDVKEHYEKLREVQKVANAIDIVDRLRSNNKRLTKWAKEQVEIGTKMIEEGKRKLGNQTLLTLLPLIETHSGYIFYIRGGDGVIKSLSKHFPEEPIENIQTWVAEGSKLLDDLNDKLLKDLEESFYDKNRE